MARYIHKVSGARVEVRDDKVMDSSWRAVGGGSDSGPADGGYDAMTVPKLRAEIERRNEGREADNLLSVDGRKPDLIAALKADDDAARGEQ